MEPDRLVVRLADIHDRGEVAVLLVLKVLCPSGRPLDDGLDLPVLQLQLLHPSGCGCLAPFERLMLVVNDEIHAALGDLRLHRLVALIVYIKLTLRTDNVADGEDEDRLRRSHELHIAAF